MYGHMRIDYTSEENTSNVVGYIYIITHGVC